MDAYTRQINTQQKAATFSPAQLFIGPEGTVTAQAKEYIQKIICPKNGCFTCITCRHIADQQHHNLLWLSTEKSYTREQLQPIFEALSFARSVTDHFFIVIQKADCLTVACANSLLKSLEEPPVGYHFILLTDRAHELLATVRSRCIMTTIEGHADASTHQELFTVFAHNSPTEPVTFLKIIEKSKITEYETVQLLDQLFEHWMQLYSQAVMNGTQAEQQKIEKIINLLKMAAQKPPMPGSCKIFWKNLFLLLMK